MRLSIRAAILTTPLVAILAVPMQAPDPADESALVSPPGLQPISGDDEPSSDEWTPVLDDGSFAESIMAALGESFASMRFEDGDGGQILRIGVVGLSAKKTSQVMSTIPEHLAGRVQTEDASFSYNELAEVQGSAEVLLRQLKATGLIRGYYVGRDPASGQIMVEVDGSKDQLDRVRAALDAVIPGAASVKEGTVSLELLGNTRDSFPPYESGLRTNIYFPVPQVWNPCTSGYIFRNGYGDFGSTGGHCANINFRVRMGSYPTDVDHIRMEQYQAPTLVYSDTAFWSLDASGWQRYSRVHVTNSSGGSNSHRSVTSNTTNGYMNNDLGRQYCYQGITSHGRCGPLSAADIEVCCDGAGKTFRVYCLTEPAVGGGDSGDPVYRILSSGNLSAAGMLAIRWTRSNGTVEACFSALDYIMYINGSSLVKA